MRFMIMHKTNAHWEAGEIPTPELIAQVGTMMGEIARTGALRSGEGLRASSQGARLRFSGGRRTVTKGPFKGENELPAGFAILRAASLEDAIEWSSRFAQVVGDVEIDVRPVTEAWDLGMAPKPEGLHTRRYMAMHKATAASEGGAPPSPELMAAMGGLLEEMTRAGVLLAAEGLLPSALGARLRHEGGRTGVMDGPFAESKELIAGYVIVEVPALQDAVDLARRYAEAVGCEEVDVRGVAGE